MARPEGEWAPPERLPSAAFPVVDGSGHVAACAFASVAVGVGTAVGSWWLIGNQSVHTRWPEQLDYAYRAPEVPHWVVATLGPIALVIAVVCVGGLVVAVSRRVIDRRWLHVAGLFALTGFLLAGIGRVATAGVIGANIGGGLAIMVLPAVAGLVVWAAVIALRIVDSARSHAPA
jgi:uncharacterized membrane protein